MLLLDLDVKSVGHLLDDAFVDWFTVGLDVDDHDDGHLLQFALRVQRFFLFLLLAKEDVSDLPQEVLSAFGALRASISSVDNVRIVSLLNDLVRLFLRLFLELHVLIARDLAKSDLRGRIGVFVLQFVAFFDDLEDRNFVLTASLIFLINLSCVICLFSQLQRLLFIHGLGLDLLHFPVVVALQTVAMAQGLAILLLVIVKRVLGSALVTLELLLFFRACLEIELSLPAAALSLQLLGALRHPLMIAALTFDGALNRRVALLVRVLFLLQPVGFNRAAIRAFEQTL